MSLWRKESKDTVTEAPNAVHKPDGTTIRVEDLAEGEEVDGWVRKPDEASARKALQMPLIDLEMAMEEAGFPDVAPDKIRAVIDRIDKRASIDKGVRGE